MKLEKRSERLGSVDVYSLTKIGEQQLQQGRARRNLIVSEFLEDADLDSSFREFLNNRGSLGPN
ncbi:MAG: hypothetical protein JO210_04635 [Acidobacteriaceae bacterium]|nr:hypothetical protein [Acidobacteriaceae bacterium]